MAIKKKKAVVKKLVKKSIKPKKQEKPIGVVAHYYDHIKVGVITLFAPLKQGDGIRIMGGEKTDFNQKVESIQMDHEEIKKGKKGFQKRNSCSSRRSY